MKNFGKNLKIQTKKKGLNEKEIFIDVINGKPFYRAISFQNSIGFNTNLDVLLNTIKTIESKVNIVEVNEKSLLGTAGTLIMNISNLDNDLLVVHCDNFSSINIDEFLFFQVF